MTVLVLLRGEVSQMQELLPTHLHRMPQAQHACMGAEEMPLSLCAHRGRNARVSVRNFERTAGFSYRAVPLWQTIYCDKKEILHG